MRLQLILASFLAITLLACIAQAEPNVSVDARSGVYQDTDHTTIVTTNTAVRANPTEHLGVDARYLADIITSASIDVLTAATPAFHETRHELEGGAHYHDADRKVSGSYVYSRENDWRSHTGNLGVSQDLMNHQLTVSVGGTLVLNDVGRSGDESFHKTLTVAGGSLGLAAVLSPRDLLSLNYSLSYLTGYQASPYRFVPVMSAVGAPLAFGMPELDPSVRVRHAVALRWNHHMFKDTALRSQARLYVDDWGIASVTAGTDLAVGFGDLEAGAFVRGYAQKHATFYASQYDRPMQYMTADRELSSFVDGFAGLRLRYAKPKLGPLEELHAELKGSGFAFKFFDFPRLEKRFGLLAEVALGVAL